MKLPRFLVTAWRTVLPRAAGGELMPREKAGTPTLVAVRPMGLFGVISEAIGGAWQRGLTTIDNTQTLLAFSAVYACLSLISGDISKLRLMLLKVQADETWKEIEVPKYSELLRKPNRYQTSLQFIEYWILSKLIWGNTYVLKERDDTGTVVALYVLNPCLVLPLVAPDGAVFYQVGADNLTGLQSGAPAIPASEIIHDRGKCLFHALVGVPPLYACAMSTTQGNRIQSNSSKFFENMSRPSGQLTAPGLINDITAERMKREFQEGFSGVNVGKLLVGGDGLKFEPFTMPADQSQLIEQLGWTVVDVARAYCMPLYKVNAGTNLPSFSNTGALNQEYYQQTLQPHIESMEQVLDHGLSLKNDTMIQMDLDGLLRMDPKTRAETVEIEMKSGVLKPNEARLAKNLSPVEGGDTPYLQQQNYSLAALAKRDASADPFAKIAPPASAPAGKSTSTDDEDRAAEEMQALLKHIVEGLECKT